MQHSRGRRKWGENDQISDGRNNEAAEKAARGVTRRAIRGLERSWFSRKLKLRNDVIPRSALKYMRFNTILEILSLEIKDGNKLRRKVKKKC